MPGGHCVLCSGVLEIKAQPLHSRSSPSNGKRAQRAQFSLTCARAENEHAFVVLNPTWMGRGKEDSQEEDPGRGGGRRRREKVI